MPKPSESEPAELDTTDHGERDAASIKILGFFFTILGSLVLVGTFWSLDDTRALTVNLVSGALLTSIGLGMIYLVRRSRNANK